MHSARVSMGFQDLVLACIAAGAAPRCNFGVARDRLPLGAERLRFARGVTVCWGVLIRMYVAVCIAGSSGCLQPRRCTRANTIFTAVSRAATLQLIIAKNIPGTTTARSCRYFGVITLALILASYLTAPVVPIRVRMVWRCASTTIAHIVCCAEEHAVVPLNTLAILALQEPGARALVWNSTAVIDHR